MALPKRKTSLQKKRQRRAHHAIGKPNLVACKSCGAFIMPHRVCPSCGFYKNRVVLAPKGVQKA
ncbi:MAG TPA: 50S ribosomal protein L32 [Leptospiraceae bacterium]|nr:50S ribosomal protein L32 [Leptospirales bacterium]HMU83365.1 50S ribosomal protein L32 [Leptospiraceae bacterium]HMW61218.1 50S ribosomal protein L32 [Leptospiraceae bacterium]HMX56727.1 50S ribosomal protein L32 [Leptospiraceae bacterium]HMY46836.1 50S ribosomal protein L32 [Leptospiraceae bacterium]